MRVSTRTEPINQAVVATLEMPALGSALALRSDWTSARPVDHRWVLDGLEPRTSITATVAGRTITAAADDDGNAVVHWDGLDQAGEPVGTATASVTVAGAHRRARLGRWDPRTVGLGGLLLAGHDHLDIATHRVHTGRGRLRANLAVRQREGGHLATRAGGRRLAHFDMDGFLTRVSVTGTGRTIASWRRDADGLAHQQGPGPLDLRIHRSPGHVVLERGGRRTQLQLDTAGRVIRLDGPAGDVVEIGWDDLGLLGRITDPAGFSHVFEHDDDGRLVAITAPGRGRVRLARTTTEHGHRVTLLTAEGRESSYQLDRLSDGTRVRTTTCCGRQPRVTRIGDGRIEVARGDGTRITSEGRTGERRVVLPSGRTHVRTVEPDGITVNGRTFQRRRNAHGSTTTTPEGRVFRLRTNDEVTTIERPSGSVTLRRDGHGQVIRLEQDARSIQLERDDVGLVTALVPDDGDATHLDHDLAGWLVAQDLPGERTIRLERGGNGTVLAIEPPGATPTRLVFQAPDLLATMDFAGTEDDVLALDHDRDGLVVGQRVGSATPLHLRRNVDGQVTEVAGETVLARLTHEHGRPVRAETGDARQVTTITRDGPLVTEVRQDGRVTGTLARSHNDDLQLAGVACGDLSARIERNGDGLPVAVGEAVLDRDAAGRVEVVRAGVVTQRWRRDGHGRVVAMRLEVDGGQAWEVTYRHDDRGRIVALTDTQLPSPGEVTYDYDRAGRLTRATGPRPFRATWGPNGNLRAWQHGERGGAATTAPGDRLAGLGDLAVDHDGAGRIASVQGDRGSGLVVRRIAHDARGLLSDVVDRPRDSGRATTTRLVRDGFGRVIAMATDARPPVRLLPGLHGHPEAVVADDGTTQALFVGGTATSTPLLAVEPERTLLLACDHLGSPRIVVDITTGQVVEQRVHDTWGGLLLQTGQSAVPFGWGGGLHDPATGLVHFPARSYSPTLMRFLSRDPLLFLAGSTNLYAFVDGDPVNRRDPTGRQQVYVCRQATDMFDLDGAEHWWIKQGDTETGMGIDPNSDGTWHGIPETAERDEGARSGNEGVTCDPVDNVDEECVADAIQTNDFGMGDELGVYGPDNTCQDWVDDVLDACSGGDYTIETNDPDAYDHWYNPSFIDTETPIDGGITGGDTGSSGGDSRSSGDGSGGDGEQGHDADSRYDPRFGPYPLDGGELWE